MILSFFFAVFFFLSLFSTRIPLFCFSCPLLFLPHSSSVSMSVCRWMWPPLPCSSFDFNSHPLHHHHGCRRLCHHCLLLLSSPSSCFDATLLFPTEHFDSMAFISIFFFVIIFRRFLHFHRHPSFSVLSHFTLRPPLIHLNSSLHSSSSCFFFSSMNHE